MNYIEKEKLGNAICFFAKRHKESAGKPLYQTFLYKYLAFLDFYCLEETGQTSLGLHYIAMDNGPVPVELYRNKENQKTDYYQYREDYDTAHGGIIIETYTTPNLDYFSEFEQKKMNQLIMRFAREFAKTSVISEKSHEEIIAWQKAYNRQKNSEIKLEDSFDLEKKETANLTMAEEAFIFSRLVHEYKSSPG